MLNQRLQQKLLQKLSPQQILLMKLLQIPSVALEQRIKQEIEENPALEVEEGDLEAEEQVDDFEDENVSDEFSDEEEYDSTDDEFDFDDYLDDDDIASYKLASNNSSADDERYEMPFSSHQSFQDFLLQQLGYRKLNEKDHQIG